MHNRCIKSLVQVILPAKKPGFCRIDGFSYVQSTLTTPFYTLNIIQLKKNIVNSK